MKSHMMQYGQVRRTGQYQPPPSRLRVPGERAENARSEHDVLGCDSDEEVCAGQAGDQGEVCEEEGGCYGPVYVAEPEDLAEVFIAGVGDVFVGVFDVGMFVGDALVG